MVKVVEESNNEIFEIKVNELLSKGYRISDSRCGKKYAAILIKRQSR